MPFTFSHPAIILPLRYLPKNYFSLTGLIIGSLTPDFEYFIRMKVQSIYSHTLYGIFWFDLPLAILLTFIFHNIVRNDLYHNLPLIIKSRISTFSDFNWNNYFKTNWIVVLISIIIGIVSHIFWDGFTHDHGYFVNHISELRNSVSLFDIKIPVLKIAQHLSSLIGAIVIVFAISKLPKDNTSTTLANKLYWVYLILFTSLIITIRFLSGLDFKAYGNIIVSIISGILLSLILTPLFIKGARKN
ncbi:DUF4184 family protein [uncultured Flavobacterium sp.]|uniref:DUF4184 family protein n=1 Tax=uncultured Flavobacterium sp. TaxID=165435 RepID=UPI003081C419